MTAELLCYLAASLVALQIVAVFLRKEQRDEIPYLFLLAADLGVLVFVRATGKYDTLFAFVAEGAALVLTLVPPVLERMEKRAINEERFGRAARFASVREMLMPGRGPARRRRILTALHQAALGGTDVALANLERELEKTKDPRTLEELRSQIASLLLYEHRYAEAITYVAAHLPIDRVVTQPALAANLIRAYAAMEDFRSAVELLRRIESAKLARDPLGAAIIQQSRLALLASAGRLDDVAGALGAAQAGGQLTDAARFWVDTARARSLSLQQISPEVQVELEAIAKDARAFVLRADAVIRRETPLTQVLVAANVIAYFTGTFVNNSGDDTWILRAGALFRPFVLAGEWWRTISAMFLHAGSLHLFVNMYGLYLLGRFTESLFGTRRFFAIYVGAGVIGAVLSTVAGGGVVSVGASGAILGLLGALIVLLIARRGVWPEAWRRTLLINLLVLGGLQIAIGFTVSMIDNAAHFGGMVGGAIFAFLLRPPEDPAKESRLGLAWASLFAAAAALAVSFTAYKVATTTLADSLLHVPTKHVQLKGGALDVPVYWVVAEKENAVVDPYFELAVAVVPGDEIDPVAHAESPNYNDPRYHALLEKIVATLK